MLRAGGGQGFGPARGGATAARAVRAWCRRHRARAAQGFGQDGDQGHHWEQDGSQGYGQPQQAPDATAPAPVATQSTAPQALLRCDSPGAAGTQRAPASPRARPAPPGRRPHPVLRCRPWLTASRRILAIEDDPAVGEALVEGIGS